MLIRVDGIRFYEDFFVDKQHNKIPYNKIEAAEYHYDSNCLKIFHSGEGKSLKINLKGKDKDLHRDILLDILRRKLSHFNEEEIPLHFILCASHYGGLILGLVVLHILGFWATLTGMSPDGFSGESLLFMMIFVSLGVKGLTVTAILSFILVLTLTIMKYRKGYTFIKFEATDHGF